MNQNSAKSRIRVIADIAELRETLDALRHDEQTIAFVPTMGALHVGHISLVQQALGLAHRVVVSIFVNPLQFGANEDLDRYPRTLDEDVEKLAQLVKEQEVDELIVFAPSAEQIYPEGQSQTTVHAGLVGTLFEGAARPGHFDGMLTVVLKLFTIVQPEIAIFGQKDAQQLYLIRQMVKDFNLPIRIVAGEIVRENDGLALSSRNRYLTDAERQLALTLNRALRAVAHSEANSISNRLEEGLEILTSSAEVKLDYLAVVDPETFAPVPDDFQGSGIIVVAARVGQTRLIDNLVQEFV